MKKIHIFSIILILLHVSIAQEAKAKIDSVKLPLHRIRIFNETILPELSEGQKAKYEILSLEEKIAEAKKEIIKKEEQIRKYQGEIKKVLAAYESEKTNSSSFLLGLFSQESKVKKDSTLYNEKSIFWGAFKWGKLKNEKE